MNFYSIISTDITYDGDDYTLADVRTSVAVFATRAEALAWLSKFANVWRKRRPEWLFDLGDDGTLVVSDVLPDGQYRVIYRATTQVSYLEVGSN